MANPDPTSFAWHNVDEHPLVLRGIGCHNRETAPSVSLVAKSVLANVDRLCSPDVIEFDTDIHIPDACATQSLRIRMNRGFYGSLEKVRSDMIALQRGEVHEVQLSLKGLELRFFSFRNETYSRGIVCVNGALSNITEEVDSRWTKRPDKIIAWISGRQSHAYCLRFAFLMPFVDPPVGSDFVRGIDNLIANLKASSKL